MDLCEFKPSWFTQWVPRQPGHKVKTKTQRTNRNREPHHQNLFLLEPHDSEALFLVSSARPELLEISILTILNHAKPSILNLLDSKSGRVMLVWNPSSGKAEVGELQVQGWPGLHIEALIHNKVFTYMHAHQYILAQAHACTPYPPKNFIFIILDQRSGQ